MNWNLLIELLTISVALITLTVNIIFSNLSSTKRNYVQISTKHRAENLDYARDLTSKILSYSSIEYMNSNKDDLGFISTKESLYYYYKGGTHLEEAELQIALDDLSKAYFQFRADKNQSDTLIQARNVFFTLSKIFEIAYWKFLKDHANASIHETDQFNFFYAKVRQEYINAGYNIKPLGQLYPNRFPSVKNF